MSTRAHQLYDIATRVECELIDMETDVVTPFWVMQAVVRLHIAAAVAAKAQDPQRPESSGPLIMMRDTMALLEWLDPKDAQRLKRHIEWLDYEHAMTCIGESLLEEILGEE